MGKLCAKGKAAAKRKFKVYPSAYANMYASSICSGKTVEGGKKKNKKMNGGSVSQDRKAVSHLRKVNMKEGKSTIIAAGCGGAKEKNRKQTKLS